MKIKTIALSRLRNEEHFQFGADVLALLGTETADALGVRQAADAFRAVHAEEDTLLERIRASALTADIAEADHARDRTAYGLAESVAAAERHFDPERREAARRVRIVLDTFGPLAPLNYAEQTAATYNMLMELANNHSREVETLRLGEWFGELARLNNVVGTLLRERDGEAAARPAVAMRDVRARADAAYRTVVEQIDALAVVARLKGTDTADHDAFAAALNAAIDRYELLLARRHGGKKKEEDGSAGGEGSGAGNAPAEPAAGGGGEAPGAPEQ